MGGGNKDCPPFLCGKGKNPVPKWPMSIKSPGCTSGGGGLMLMRPGSTDENDPFTPCCDTKNACYQICGSKKSACDEEFKLCMIRECEKKEGDAKANCTKNMEVQKMVLNFGGCQEFDEGQRQSCACVEKETVASRRKRVISNFYKKYNPEGMNKVEGLAAKTDSARKLAALLNKLTTKYPESITRIEDPSKKMMDDLLKDIDKDKEKRKNNKDEIVEGEIEGDHEEL